MYSTVTSRKSERLFGERATGRSTLMKLEVEPSETSEYNPAKDTVLDAFVRMLANRATAA